jgi:hypothetical protein
MKIIKKYFIQANEFLRENKKFYLFYLLFYTLININTFLLNKQIDPNGLTTLWGLAVIYVYTTYFFALPALFDKKKSDKKLTPSSLRKIILQATKRSSVFILWVIGFIAVIALSIYLFIDLPFHTHVTQEIFSYKTKNNFNFGFYPAEAFGSFIAVFLAPLYFFLPIVYYLSNRSFIYSLKKSIVLYYKNFATIAPVVALYASYQFIYFLFTQDGNYLSFVSNIIISYFDVVLLATLFILYKDRYKIIELAAKEKKEKSPNKASYWLRLGALIAFAEVNIFFGYGFLLTYFADNQQLTNSSSYVYVALAAVAPFFIYALKLNKRTLNINLLSFKMAIFVLIAMIGFAAAFPKDEQKQAVVKQEFSGEELLKAVNVKREAYGTNRLAKNSWTCVAAQIELEENIKVGNGQFTPQESFTTATSETKEKYKKTATSKSDVLPNFLFEYVTYGYGLDATIDQWDKNGNKLLFLDKSYTVGCAVAKDGYGVVMVGEENLKPNSMESARDYDSSM